MTKTSTVAGEGQSPLLQMKGVCKDFPAGRVLHDVDFCVERGHVHALVGENGAGKSTLMKILAGVYPDYEGQIVIDGEPVAMSSPSDGLHKGIAVIYQEFSLVPDMTVAQNITLGNEARGPLPGLVGHRASRRAGTEELGRLGIDLPHDALAGDLDVGQQQMAEIAKAVSRRAKVLVMDEPTARLSMTQRDRLFEIMRKLAAQGVGIVYISHFLEEVFAVSSHLTVLRDGRRVSSGPTSGYTLSKVTHHMVGEKYNVLAGDAAVGGRERPVEAAAPPALTLKDFEVPGKVAPTNLTLRAGDVIGLAGLQGSGRTDLARAIVGTLKGVRGSLSTRRFTGVPTSPTAALAAGISMLPANRKTEGILEVSSLRDNIEVSALRRQLASGGLVRRKKTTSLVASLIEAFAVRPRQPALTITALSGGNQQKVLFARAAAAETEVLILDQPTAGVDVGAKVELYEQIDKATASGTAVLLISDDLSELLRLSDEIAVVHKGVVGPLRSVEDFDRATLLEAITRGDVTATAR